jgi:hypothetical protein
LNVAVSTAGFSGEIDQRLQQRESHRSQLPSVGLDVIQPALELVRAVHDHQTSIALNRY